MLSKLRAAGLKVLDLFNAACIIIFLILGTATLCAGTVLILRALLALTMSPAMTLAAGLILVAGVYGCIIMYLTLKDTELDDIFNLAKVYLFGGISLVLNLIRIFIAWVSKRGDN